MDFHIDKKITFCYYILNLNAQLSVQAVEKPRMLRICMLASGTLEFASFFIEIKQVVRMQSSKAPRKLFAQHTNPPLLVSQQPFFV
jgi:hypothetical protein